MNKAEFVKVMNGYMKKREENEAWLNDVEKVFSGAWEPIVQHNYEEFFINTLTDVMNDTDEWIKYFIWERDGNWFTCEVNGVEKEINCFAALYDLITGKEF